MLLQRVNSHLELSVSDTGIGIPASYLPHVFDRFSQKDSSTTRAFGGLGLGLAICKQLVELHGGSIRAASEGEGKGATFSVQLPLSIVQSDEQGAPRVHPTAETHSGEMLSLPRLDGVHVFIVDDEPDARELLRTVLEDQGAKVTSFASAEDALAALKISQADDPDLRCRHAQDGWLSVHPDIARRGIPQRADSRAGAHRICARRG